MSRAPWVAVSVERAHERGVVVLELALLEVALEAASSAVILLLLSHDQEGQPRGQRGGAE